MEHKDFKKLKINKCLNKNCNQTFTEDNIKIVIWQYGLIILTQREVYGGCEEFFGSSIQDKETEKKSLNGYIGITCPKCSKTSLHKRTAQEIREFKNFLSIMLKLDQYTQNEKGESSIETLGPFPLNLRYYSPFPVKNEALKDLEVEGYFFDEPEDESYFFDDFQIHIAGEEKDLNVQFCSYIYEDTTPAGICTNIYWFKEQDIPMIMKLENEGGVRLLPRYHYFSELMGKIDSLLKYYPYLEKYIQEAKNDYDSLLQQSIKNLKNSTGTNNSIELPSFKSFLETRQKEILNNTKMINDFFEVLVLTPYPLKNIAGKPLKGYDYLWAEKAPFSEVDFPVNFLFKNQPDEFCNKAKSMMKSHQSMMDNVRENFTQQYVQDFLQNNLIDFLEEYEEYFNSNQFSYATVWDLKESYLVGLYKATNKGLSSEVQYVMKREDKSWKIVFNGKISSPLIGRGFAYIYHLLCNENEYFYHSELYLAGGGGTSVQIGGGKSEQKRGSKVEYNDTPGKSYAIPEPMIEKKDLKNLFKQIKQIKIDIHDAKEFEKKAKEYALKDEYDHLMNYLSKVYNSTTKKIRYKKDKKTRDAINAVAKAIERALNTLEKKDKEVFKHIAAAIDHKHLYQETVSYRPAPDDTIKWILA